MRLARSASWRAWAGWVGGAVGWFLTQQLGSILTQAACGDTNPFVVLMVGLAGALPALVGLLLSFGYWRRPAPGLSEPSAAPSRFVALTGSGSAAIFIGAIVLQTLGGVLIPRCFG